MTTNAAAASWAPDLQIGPSWKGSICVKVIFSRLPWGSKEVGNRWTVETRGKKTPYGVVYHTYGFPTAPTSITHTGSPPPYASIRHVVRGLIAMGNVLCLCVWHTASDTRQCPGLHSCCNLLIFALLWSNLIKLAVFTFFSVFGVKSIVGH